MTVRALTNSFANTLKGTFIPAALVAAGRSIPKFTESHTASLEALKGFGIKFQEAGTLAYGRFTNLTLTDLPQLIQAVPSQAQSAWGKGSTQMTVAAVWGGTSTLTNEFLKIVPGIKNQAKLRAVVSIIVGATAAVAACEYGLGKTADPHMFVDTAIKVATIALPYMAVTTTVDTALGFTGASSSALAAIITTACKVAQTGVRALSLPGSPRLINVPGASDASTADPRFQEALALSIQAQMTAARAATTARSLDALVTHIRGAHPGLTTSLAESIAKSAWGNKVDDVAEKPVSRKKSRRRHSSAHETSSRTAADSKRSSEDDTPAPAGDTGDGKTAALESDDSDS